MPAVRGKNLGPSTRSASGTMRSAFASVKWSFVITRRVGNHHHVSKSRRGLCHRAESRKLLADPVQFQLQPGLPCFAVCCGALKGRKFGAQASVFALEFSSVHDDASLCSALRAHREEVSRTCACYCHHLTEGITDPRVQRRYRLSISPQLMRLGPRFFATWTYHALTGGSSISGSSSSLRAIAKGRVSAKSCGRV
jgi:hypothetical protein